MPGALKHRAISRQEKLAFSAPVGLSWDSPPPPTECADGRTYGRTDGRSRDYYVTTKISRIDRLPYFLSNGAPLAGFARRLRYKPHTTHNSLFRSDKELTLETSALDFLYGGKFTLSTPLKNSYLCILFKLTFHNLL